MRFRNEYEFGDMNSEIDTEPFHVLVYVSDDISWMISDVNPEPSCLFSSLTPSILGYET